MDIKKDPANHNHLIVDEYAAGVVREIFDLYMKGYGKSKIASILSERGILIPSIYKREILGIHYYNAKALETTKNWSYQTIHSILNNEIYTGYLIQNKANTLSYKDKKKKSLPKSQWIVAADTHEAIISRDVFEHVQELQKIRTKMVNAEHECGIFSGILFCGDCKHAMARKYKRHGSHEFIGYICKTYKTIGKKFCESHSINHEDLEYAVLLSIQDEARKILRQRDIDALKMIQLIDETKAQYELEKEHLQKQIEKIQKFKKKSYDNYMEELISKNEYIKYVEGYEAQIQKLNAQKEELFKRMDLQKELEAQYDEWVDRFTDYINIEKLTREIVLELVEKIEVNHDGSIDIYYRFRNPYENMQ